jgi:hypothetical protein
MSRLLLLLLILLNASVFSQTYTRADSLRGCMTPFRDAIDIISYDLNIKVDIDIKNVKEKIYDTNVNIFSKFMYYITNRHEGIGAEQDTLNEIISS